MIPLWICSVLLIVIIVHICLRYTRFARIIDKIPGPYANPIIGNVLLLNERVDKLWTLARFYAEYYYPIVRAWFFWIVLVALFHPGDLEVCLSSRKNIKKSFVYSFFQSWLGNGLLTSSGDKWYQRRRILTPAFHFNVLKQYLHAVVKHTDILINNLRNQGDESVQELLPFSARYVLITLIEAALGVPMDEENSAEVDEYLHAVRSFEDDSISRLMKPYISNTLLPLWRTLYRRQNETIKTLRKFENKLIEKRRAYHERTNYEYLKKHHLEGNDNDNTYTGSKKKLAMLDLLLSASMDGLIDDEGIREEVSTFIFAGHDTSAVALTFTFMLLAENKEAQDRARAEVTEIIDNTKGDIGQSEIQEFHFLERCIKESLRLFPPVPILMRETTDDMQLKKYLIPAGVQMAYVILEAHRDPNFWEEPMKFDPDRFLPERSQNRHAFSYVPFSAGPRNCIGQKFAMMEFKYLLAKILYNFRLEAIDRTANVKLLPGLVLAPQKPVHAKFIRIR